MLKASFTPSGASCLGFKHGSVTPHPLPPACTPICTRCFSPLYLGVPKRTGTLVLSHWCSQHKSTECALLHIRIRVYSNVFLSVHPSCCFFVVDREVLSSCGVSSSSHPLLVTGWHPNHRHCHPFPGSVVYPGLGLPDVAFLLTAGCLFIENSFRARQSIQMARSLVVIVSCVLQADHIG